MQASTCYGHDNSYVADAVAAHPKRFTGVFSADVLAPDATDKDAPLDGARPDRHAALHLRQHHERAGRLASTIRNPFRPGAYAADHGLSICMQMSASGIPQLVKMIERFPKVKVLLDHMARPMLDDGPPYAAAASLFGLARYPSVYLKLTKRNFEQAKQRQGDAGDVLSQARRRVRRAAVCPGARIIRPRKARCRISWRRAQGARASLPQTGPGLDFRQDRAGALSGAGKDCRRKITIKKRTTG